MKTKKLKFRTGLKITAQNDGTYDYIADWGARGEYSYLLDLDVYTN